MPIEDKRQAQSTVMAVAIVWNFAASIEVTEEVADGRSSEQPIESAAQASSFNYLPRTAISIPQPHLLSDSDEQSHRTAARIPTCR